MWMLVIAILVTYIVYNLTPVFDPDDAQTAVGKVINLSDGWTVTYGDDTTDDAKIPSRFRSRSDENTNITLTRTIDSDMASLSLRIQLSNAAVRVFCDNMPIYSAGMNQSVKKKSSEALSRKPADSGEEAETAAGAEDEGTVSDTETTDKTPAEEVPEKPEGDDSDIGMNRDRNLFSSGIEGLLRNRDTELTASDDNLIDMPDTISDGTELRIVLTPVNLGADVLVSEVYAAKRDIAIVSQLRSVFLMIVFCVIIMLTVIALGILDIINIITGKGTRGMFRLGVFGLLVVIYTLVNTKLPILFFGNETFFTNLEQICYCMLPMFLIMYYEVLFHSSSFKLGKNAYALMWVDIIVPLIQLLLSMTTVVTLDHTAPVTTVLFVVTILFICWMNFDLWLRRERRVSQLPTIIGVVSLLVACVVEPVAYIFSLAINVELIRVAGITAFILMFTVQQVEEMVIEFKSNVEEQASQLLEQSAKLQEQNVALVAANEKAEEATREAVLANEAKSRFLANMSHEIRTPINAVMGMDEMILRETKDASVRDYAADIYSAAQSLLSIINDILDLSKIESGKMEIVPVDYDVSSMIHDVVNLIEMRAKNKDLNFEVKVSSEIPARLYGDDVRIRQVMTNILTNGVKYTETGSVYLRVSGERDGEIFFLHVEVEDTGIGIKPEDLPKLTAAFERIEESRNRNVEGTGLGMNITTQLLDLMDSHMEVDSVYGKGSTFSFTVRQKITDATPIGDFETRVKNLSENYHFTKSFVAPDAEILVVDDNSLNRKVFISLLKATLINVTEASGGEECLAWVREKHFDIIFLDHMMPGMDGVETLHAMRAMEDYPNAATPVFVLTANAVAGACENYLKEGFDGFVSKPVVSDKLERVIRDNLPASMVSEVETGSGEGTGEASGGELDLAALPAVDGLDWNYAWLHLPETELLASTVRDFHDAIDPQADRLQESYTALMNGGSKESFAAYRVQVHSMKSSAAIIGIILLAGIANTLEFAARDENMAVILSMHSVFIDAWRSYRRKLLGVFGIGEEKREEQSLDIEVVKKTLEMLKYSMSEMDLDGADECVARLQKALLFPEQAAKLSDIAEAVTDIDDERVAALADELLGEL